MIDGVECSTEVKEDEDVELSGVAGEQEVVCDFYKSSLCTVF